MRSAFPGPVNWDDFEFIREEPPKPDGETSIVLTGWETIVFELADEDVEEDPSTVNR